MQTEFPNFQEYLIKESEHVRKVYDDRVSQTRSLERFSLLATGVIWSWCATNYELATVKILIWMPALITFLFGLRAWGISKVTYSTRDYLVKIEGKINLPADIGWGRHLKATEEPRIIITAYIFWAVLQILTIFIPIFIEQI